MHQLFYNSHKLCAKYSLVFSILFSSQAALAQNTPSQAETNSTTSTTPAYMPLPEQANSPSAAINEACMLARSNNNEEAIAKLKSILKQSPNIPEAHYNLALVLAKSGKQQDAINELSQALAINPNYDSAMLTLGGLYQLNGKTDMALKTYKDYVVRFPQNKDVTKVSDLIKRLENASNISTGNLSK